MVESTAAWMVALKADSMVGQTAVCSAAMTVYKLVETKVEATVEWSVEQMVVTTAVVSVD